MNGGLLRSGNPGNVGGTGRPASLVRLRCRGSFDQRIPVLESIADDRAASASDRIAAVDKLGKYGLDARTQMGIDEVRERVRATLGIIREELGPQVAERIVERIRSQWAA